MCYSDELSESDELFDELSGLGGFSVWLLVVFCVGLLFAVVGLLLLLDDVLDRVRVSVCGSLDPVVVFVFVCVSVLLSMFVFVLLFVFAVCLMLACFCVLLSVSVFCLSFLLDALVLIGLGGGLALSVWYVLFGESGTSVLPSI